MKIHDEERGKAIATNATIIVCGQPLQYRVENVETRAIIAEGFVALASAERYAKVIRDQQNSARMKSAQ
jgi:hypothetical protein